jgi:hypothetical protein
MRIFRIAYFIFTTGVLIARALIAFLQKDPDATAELQDAESKSLRQLRIRRKALLHYDPVAV